MIEELNKKDIHQIMDIWLKENKRTHTYIPEEYWDNHFEDVKKEILNAEIYVYKEKEEIDKTTNEKEYLMVWKK